jgi:hypothetical protein
VDHVHGLQRAHHDFEVDDAAVFAPANEVDAVDVDPVQHAHELEHGVMVSDHLADLAERVVVQDVHAVT